MNDSHDKKLESEKKQAEVVKTFDKIYEQAYEVVKAFDKIYEEEEIFHEEDSMSDTYDFINDVLTSVNNSIHDEFGNVLKRPKKFLRKIVKQINKYEYDALDYQLNKFKDFGLLSIDFYMDGELTKTVYITYTATNYEYL